LAACVAATSEFSVMDFASYLFTTPEVPESHPGQVQKKIRRSRPRKDRMEKFCIFSTFMIAER